MGYVTGLQCHLCKAMFPAQALWVCDKCLGPLEVIYDYDAVKRDMTREKIESCSCFCLDDARCALQFSTA